MKKRNHLSLVESEPAMVRAVTAVVVVLASLGVSWAVDLDEGTIAAIATVLGLLVPLFQGLWTRYGVTANAKVVTRVTLDGDVVAGDASTAPTGQVLDLGQAYPSGVPVATAPVKPELVSPAA